MQLLITGRIERTTVERALYSGWAVSHWWDESDGLDGIVGVLVAPDFQAAGFGAQPQADRLRSFGSVGVRQDFNADDVEAALARI